MNATAEMQWRSPSCNHLTTYNYDTESNLTSIVDANNHTTYFAYDAFGRVNKTTFPSTLFETYGYDLVGNLTSKVDRKLRDGTFSVTRAGGGRK